MCLLTKPVPKATSEPPKPESRSTLNLLRGGSDAAGLTRWDAAGSLALRRGPTDGSFSTEQDSHPWRELVRTLIPECMAVVRLLR